MYVRIISVILLVIVLSISCDRQEILRYNDHRPPSKIKDLKLIDNSDFKITLSWTASGDDGLDGAVVSYRIHYCTDSNLVAQKSSWQTYKYPPKPKPTGTTQQCEITGLSPDTTYWFGIRSIDKSGNRSVLSNIVKKDEVEPIVLKVSSPQNNDYLADLVLITIKATGDDKPDKILFYGDNQLFDSASGPSWQVMWVLTEFEHGSNHSIYAATIINNEVIIYSDTINITIDSMLAYPVKPAYLTISNITEIGAKIYWPLSREADFDYYQLTWNAIGEQDENQNSMVMDFRFDTSYTITNLNCLTEYTVSLKVHDRYNHSRSIDNKFETLDSIPATVIINHLGRTSSFAGLIEWEQSVIHDFAYYEIVRSTDSIINSNDQVVALITNIDQTSWLDEQYDFSIDHYYSVQTIDFDGLRSTSNPVLLPACLTDNWALEFDGDKDFALIPYQREVFKSSEFTIEMWLRPNIRNIVSVPFSQHINAMEIIAQDMDLRWGLTGCMFSIQGHWFYKEEWVHLALTRSRTSGNEQLFINGELAMTRSCEDWYLYNDDLYLGCRAGSRYFYEGLMDEVKIWNYARSNSEIADNYQYEVNGSPDGLVGYWSFNEGGGGVSYSGIGPSVRLGQSDQVDISDPLWVLSSVPFVKD